MEKILRTATDSYGEQTPVAVLFQKGGLFRLWEINCMSSMTHNLGNCLCINHPVATETPVSTAEVIRRFGEDALDGFDTQSNEQIVFDAFCIEINELEAYLRVSYWIGVNPLPALRKAYDLPIVFSENPELLTFPEEEPGTIVFVINSRGEISVREA